jgi:hypothetical protein
MKAGPGGRGSIERRPSPTRERRQERAHYAFSCSLSACLRALIDFGRSSPPRSSPSAFTSSCSLPNSLSNFLCILPASVTLPLLPILVAAHSRDSLMDEMAGSGIVVRAVKEEGWLQSTKKRVLGRDQTVYFFELDGLLPGLDTITPRGAGGRCLE